LDDRLFHDAGEFWGSNRRSLFQPLNVAFVQGKYFLQEVLLIDIVNVDFSYSIKLILAFYLLLGFLIPAVFFKFLSSDPSPNSITTLVLKFERFRSMLYVRFVKVG
jgi:hypothetical protein